MVRREMIKIDEDLCTGCGLCIPACAEGALEIVDGKARVVSEVLCDGLGACLGECPEGALMIEEREAPEFDEAAVEQRLAELGWEPLHASGHAGHAGHGHPGRQHGHGHPGGQHDPSQAAEVPSGCPGSLSRMLGQAGAGDAAFRETGGGAGGARGEVSEEGNGGRSGESLLSHWPVQLTLANPVAPAFRHADLLIAADCAPVAYRRFHEDYLDGRSVVIACPKLDDAQSHLHKLVELFQTAQPESVTILHMEVPCCFGLVQLVHEAAERAGLGAPVREEVISVEGERAGTQAGAARR